ncbi:acyl-CoA cholesterol acyltransferase [Paenibacillus marinisediminis]
MKRESHRFAHRGAPRAQSVKRLTDERGAVSIFLIFVVMIIFTMMAVFIDYARIAAMELRSETLGQTAARSILSAYDPKLQQQYGLFAYGQTDPALITEYVMMDHTPKSSDSLSWINLQIENHNSSIERPIGLLEEFEHQVLEDMKYKAPIQITYELINKMKPVADPMKEAAQTADLLNTISKDYDKRNRALEEALRMQQEARDRAGRADIPRLIGEVDQLWSSISTGSINSASDIVRMYEDYRRMIRDDAELESEEKLYSFEIAQYETEAFMFSNRYYEQIQQAAMKHSQLIEKAEQAVVQARQFNKRMQDAIQKARTESASSYQGYDHTADAKVPGTVNDSVDTEVIKGINGSIDSLVLPESFFDEYDQELQRQSQLLTIIERDAARFKSKVSSVLSGSESIASAASSITETWQAWRRYEAAYIQLPANVLTERQGMLDKLTETDSEKRRYEQEARQQLRELSGLMEMLANLTALQEHQQNFDDVSSKAEALRAFNHSTLSRGENGLAISGDAEEANAEAMKGMTELFTQLGDLATDARDRMYRNEYAFLYFTSFDPNHLQTLFQTGSPSQELASALDISNQELEYIMYGFQNPAGNIAAAYGEIFAMRLAIRTMEGFVEYAGLVHPLVILAAAIVYGLTMAAKDLIDLVTTNTVPLSKYVSSITLSYSDFLRLFMMMHGDKQEMSLRMLALIYYNTGINPAERGTYAQIQMKARMKLWFLPGVMTALGHAGLLGGKVRNGYYEVDQLSAYSY